MIGQNTPGGQDVPGGPRNFYGLAHIVQLGQRYLGRTGPVLIQQTTELMANQLCFGDLHQHACQLVLDQLIGCDGLIKYPALDGEISGFLKTGDRRAKSPTGNAVAGMVQTLEN